MGIFFIFSVRKLCLLTTQSIPKTSNNLSCFYNKNCYYKLSSTSRLSVSRGIQLHCFFKVSLPNRSDALSQLQNKYNSFSVQQIIQINSLSIYRVQRKRSLFSRKFFFKTRMQFLPVHSIDLIRSFQISENCPKCQPI